MFKTCPAIFTVVNKIENDTILTVNLHQWSFCAAKLIIFILKLSFSHIFVSFLMGKFYFGGEIFVLERGKKLPILPGDDARLVNSNPTCIHTSVDNSVKVIWHTSNLRQVLRVNQLLDTSEMSLYTSNPLLHRSGIYLMGKQFRSRSAGTSVTSDQDLKLFTFRFIMLFLANWWSI
jgi:hypothetical protein